MKKLNKKKQPLWKRHGLFWVEMNTANGFINKVKRGYKVTTFHQSGDFYMGMEKYNRTVCYRNSLTKAKKELILRAETK